MFSNIVMSLNNLKNNLKRPLGRLRKDDTTNILAVIPNLIRNLIHKIRNIRIPRNRKELALFLKVFKLHTKRKFSNFVHWIKADRKNQAFSLVGIFLILIPTILIFTSLLNRSVEAGWFDYGYSFRRRIPITNGSGSNQTDYQHQLTLDTSSLISTGKMQADCDDNRFTNLAGTLLEYWIEPNTCNTATTLIWVKVDTIPTSGTDIYWYYGNPSAIGVSSTSQTFVKDLEAPAASWPLDDPSGLPYSRSVHSYKDFGRNIIANSNFDTDTVWTKGTCWSIASGVAKCDGSNGSNSDLNSNTGFTVAVTGKAYELTYTISDYSSGTLTPYLANANATVRSSNGTFTQVLIAATTSATLIFRASAGFIGSIDNISIRQLNIPSSSQLPSNLITDGDMETSGVGLWVVGNAATLTKQTTNPHGGSQVLRVARNGTNNPQAQKNGVLTADKVYRISGYMRSDGSATPLVAINAGTNISGTTSTDWQPFDFIGVAPAAGSGIVYFRATTSTGTQYVEFDNITITEDTTIRPGQLIQDANLEASGTGSWVSGGSAVASKETSSPHGGTQLIRVTSGGSTFGYTSQTLLNVGKNYYTTGYGRGDGSNYPDIGFGNFGVAIGTTSTSWQFLQGSLVASSGISNSFRLFTPLNSGYTEYDDLTLNEISPLSGIPTNGVVQGASVGAGGHGTSAYSFDGTNDTVNVNSSDFNSIFNPNMGTIVAWAKVSDSSVWTDGVFRYITYFGADGNNRILIQKASSNNALRVYYIAGGNSKQMDTTYSSTGWFQIALSWDKTSDQLKMYLNGVQTGGTTGLGSFSGNLASTTTTIGAANTTGNNSWSGLINDVKLYGRALTTEEISSLYSSTTDIQSYTTSNYPNKELFRKVVSSISTGTIASEEVGASPAAHWSFDEGQGQSLNDSSTNINNGTLGVNNSVASDDPTWQTEDQCISGKCLLFDGSNDYVSVPDSSSLSPTSTVTISTWINPNATPGDAGKSTPYFGIIAKDGGYSGTPAYGIRLLNSMKISAHLSYGSSINQAQQMISNATISKNTWTHVALVLDTGSNNFRLYINGVLDITNNYANPLLDSSDVLKIGLSDNRFFSGKIDEPKIYRYARSAAQIKTEYNQYAATLGLPDTSGYLSNGLIGYWKMDEVSWTNNCSTATVMDSSGNANHGSACPNSTGPTGGASGKFGNAGTFDGVDDYIALTTPFNPGNSNFTLSAWININSSESSSTKVQSIFGNNQNTPFFGYQPANKSFRARNDVTEVISSQTVNNLADSNWHHVALNVDQSSLKVNFYVDGSLLSTQTLNGTYGGNTNQYLAKLGNSYVPGAVTQFKGSIDEARIYNKSLSASEISQLYTWAPPAVGHWKLDDNAGTSAIDSGSSGSNGTLTNGPNWNEGKIGQGVIFDGADDSVVLPNSTALQSNQGTMSAWIKTGNAGSGYRGIFVKPQAYGVYLQNNVLGVYDFGGATWRNSGITLNDNTWHHISVSFVSGVTNGTSFYVDGVLKGVTTLTISNQTNPPAIGYGSGVAQYFTGSIDEVKFYNYVRNQSQVLEDMAGDPAPSNAGQSSVQPIAYYSLDEQSGQVINNSGAGGSSLNGTLGTSSSVASDDPTWKTKTDCQQNGCLSFDGNDMSQMGTVNDFNFGTGSFSVDFWAKFNSKRVISPISKTTSGYSVGGFRFYINASDQMEWAVMDGTNTCSILSTVTQYLSKWSHYTGTWDSQTKKCNFYIDGKLISSFTNTSVGSISNSTYKLTIGNMSAGLYGIDGFMDEVKIYNTAITPTQIKLDMNAGGYSLDFGSNAPAESTLLNGGAGNPPVAYWNFDERTGTTANDKSGNGYSGTLTNSPTWGPGKIGQAIKFDGVNDYVDIGNPVNLQSLTAITISSWVKFNSNTANQVIIGKEQGGSPYGWSLRINSNSKLDFMMNNVLTETNIPSLNVWHHIAASNDGSTNRLYIDGTLVATSSSSYFNSTGNINIGRSQPSGRYINGSIDDVKIYNYARTQSQISYDFNRGAPIAWWQFDECQGSTAYDNSGLGNNATITIGATGSQSSIGTCNTASSAWGNGSSGKFNSSFSFDGSDDYVLVNDPTNNSLDLGLGDMTIAFWAKTTNAGSNPAIISKESYAPSFFGYSIRALGTNRYQFNIGNNSSPLTLNSNTVTMSSWNHIVFTISRTGNVTSYVNGVIGSTLDISALSSADLNNTSQFNIGKQAGSPSLFHSGQIDDVRIYNYTLSPSQIKQVMNNGAAVFYGPVQGQP